MPGGESEESPCVSVIIATYNWSTVLRYAIESVLGQAFADFELIVVGDGCTDDTAEVVASFVDPRIRWHNLERHSGSQWLPNNTGIAMARGKYIAYLGHDDLWLPNHLLRLVQAAEAVAADVAYAVAELIGPMETGFRALTGLSDSGQYEKGLLFAPSSVMHTRASVLAIGGWRDHRLLHISPDNDLFFRLWAAGKQFVPTNELTVIKFPAVWRRNSYRDRHSAEQATYLRRIRTEPDFVSRELLAVTRSYIWERTIAIERPNETADLPPGWHNQQVRQIRGLDREESSESLPLDSPEVHAQSVRGRDFRWLFWRETRSALITEEQPARALSPPRVWQEAPVGTFAGFLEGVTTDFISGWAWDSARPHVPLTLDVYVEDRLLGTTVADLFRQDLRDAGIGDGRHNFIIEGPALLNDGQPHTISVFIAGTDIALRGTPKTLESA